MIFVYIDLIQSALAKYHKRKIELEFEIKYCDLFN